MVLSSKNCAAVLFYLMIRNEINVKEKPKYKRYQDKQNTIKSVR